VKCRSCGAEIAEKAIVCYRCGTPTAIPQSTPPPVRRRAGRPAWIAVVIILAIIAAGVWLIPKTPPASAARWSTWAALVVVTFLVVWRLRRRGRT